MLAFFGELVLLCLGGFGLCGILSFFSDARDKRHKELVKILTRIEKRLPPPPSD